jgi:hypothetical protein
MDINVLAAATAAALAPLLASGAEKFAEEFGKDAYSKTKLALDKLRERLKGKPEAEKALALPETAATFQAATGLAEVVQAELVDSPDFVQELAPLIQEVAVLILAAAVSRPGGDVYDIKANIVGVAGPGGQATFNLGPDALDE